MKSRATTSITLDTRSEKKNGKYLVKPCVNHITTAKYYRTASSCRCSIKSLLAFKDKLSLEAITTDFLRGYEQWMTNTKNASKTTICIYTCGLKDIKIFQKRVKDTNSLPHNYTNAIGEDHHGNLFVGTSRGLSV